MWRRLYLLSLLVRLYFAFSPSYIHPDEHYQGPEIIAGEIFGWPSSRTWEFTSAHPVRSIFPLWVLYGCCLTLLKWVWEGLGYGEVPPDIVFNGLRALMVLLNFVLGDWALQELIPTPRDRRVAIVLVSSSYVLWTYQAHTFSNSTETLIVLWILVLINRLSDPTKPTLARTCCGLAFLGVLGIFNRITFPAYIALPLCNIIPGLFRKPLRIPILLGAGLLAVLVAVTLDTEYYTGTRPSVLDLSNAVLAPWNNLVYNLDEANLAEHGLHPYWQHFVANLPQLVGPAVPLLIFSSRKDTLYWSGIIGIAVLSCFRHQEPRFLLAAVPLLLGSVKLPQKGSRAFLVAWVAFNLLAGVLFGTYHQGGVVPVQTWIQQELQHQSLTDVHQIYWWKTYSPPRWLLGHHNEFIATKDMMGQPGRQLMTRLTEDISCSGGHPNRSLLVAPTSAEFLDTYITLAASDFDIASMRTSPDSDQGEARPSTADRDKRADLDAAHGSPRGPISLRKLWEYRRHIGLDDLDFGDDGVWPTLKRVIGRRGLTVWEISRIGC